MQNIRLKCLLFIISFYVLNVSSLFARSQEWQQEVNYNLDVTLLEEKKSISGSCVITYINNSPDTLAELWLRFPPDALNKNSTVNKTPQRGPSGYYNKIPEWQYGSLTIHKISCDSRKISLKKDGSIGYVELNKPLATGDTLSFELKFTTKFPVGRAASRIGWRNGQYKGAYWYPMICAYTPEYGWTVNRYYGTAEAYGEFGNYVVKYRVPNGYIVASTGELINESEVLPENRLKALSINNPNPENIRATDQKVETWTYFAENVPDVAFVMDRNFRIEKLDFGHFQAWSFVRAGREKEWHDAAEIIGWTIQQLEEIYGTYPWSRVVATDSWSAMEYPQLTMMCSSSPRYTYVMIHEVVHNYTPMILHSSSVDEVWIDEGFTTFIEHELTNKWFGTKWNRDRTFNRGPFSRQYTVQDEVLRGSRPYLEKVLVNEDSPMTIGTDTAKNYMLMRVSSYYKTPVMFNALCYVLGEEAFWNGFKKLYKDHALSHITEKDVVNAFEDASGRSLWWFFKQYIETGEDLDYKINYSENILKIRRIGGIKLPLKVFVRYGDGSSKTGVIPFLQSDPVEDGYDVFGYWDQVHEPGKEFQIDLNKISDKTVVEISLDKNNRLVDRNPLDSFYPDPPVASSFDTGIFPLEPYPVNAYRYTYGIAEGYNSHNGLMAGVSLNGSYMEMEENFSLEALYPMQNTEDGLNFRFGLSHPISRMPGETYLTAYFGKMHSDRWYETGLNRKWRSWGYSYREAEINSKVGTWEKPDPTGGRSATPYLYTSLNIKSSIYSRLNWEQNISFINEFSSGAVGVQWNSEIRKRVYHYWMGLLETRLAYNGDHLSDGFCNTLNSGSRYNVLGHPLLGGTIGYTGTSNWPQTDTRAVLSSYPGNEQYDSFASYEFNLYRPLSSRFFRWTFDSIQKSIEMMAFGIYQSGSIFHEKERYDVGWGMEAGTEFGIYNFYGADIVLRLTPFYKWNMISDRYESDTGNWEWEDWNNHLYLYVSLDSDKFFRK